MNEFIKNKAAGGVMITISCFLTWITAVIYAIFTNPYHLLNNKVLISLVLTGIIEVLLVIKNSSMDSYLQILTVVFATLALVLFIQDSIGTINDYINEVVFMGSGAPIGGITFLSLMMLLVIVMNIIACFMKKVKV